MAQTLIFSTLSGKTVYSDSALHFIIWPILISIALLATEGKLIGTWYYEDFVGPAHTLWFLGMWLLGIVPFLIIVAVAYPFIRILKRPAED